jgi:hypothetical protein
MAVLFPGFYKPLGFQALDVTAVKPLTLPPGTQFALICAHTAAVRWRDDGIIPTPSIGMIMLPDVEPEGFLGGSLAALQFLSTTGAAQIYMSYYG